MKTPEQLANEIINTLQAAGLTRPEMLQVIRIARQKLEYMQATNAPHPCNPANMQPYNISEKYIPDLETRSKATS